MSGPLSCWASAVLFGFRGARHSAALAALSRLSGSADHQWAAHNNRLHSFNFRLPSPFSSPLHLIFFVRRCACACFALFISAILPSGSVSARRTSATLASQSHRSTIRATRAIANAKLCPLHSAAAHATADGPVATDQCGTASAAEQQFQRRTQIESTARRASHSPAFESC